MWDRFPEFGIPDSWGTFLGLGKAVESKEFYRVYDVSGKTAIEVARQVASKTKKFGQDAVQLLGPENKPVTKLALGTGAITPLKHMLEEFDIDIAICSDDGFCYWQNGGFAIDMDFPVIVVNHTVSEEAGMINLSANLAKKFKELPVHHIPQKCPYKLIHA